MSTVRLEDGRQMTLHMVDTYLRKITVKVVFIPSFGYLSRRGHTPKSVTLDSHQIQVTRLGDCEVETNYRREILVSPRCRHSIVYLALRHPRKLRAKFHIILREELVHEGHYLGHGLRNSLGNRRRQLT